MLFEESGMDETELVVLDAEGRETSYRATLLPGRRHQAANTVALATLAAAARCLGGKVVRARGATTDD